MTRLVPIRSQAIISRLIIAIMPAVKQSLHALADQPLVRKVVGKAKSSDIIDIRGDKVEINLKEEVNSLFNPTEGPRRLPTLLLYDEKGLQLFEDVRPPSQSTCIAGRIQPAYCRVDHIFGRILLDKS